jgi:NADPH-dependent 2,4-dienoyl-CoA reductase/sulfur reductase-like enzyme
MEKGKSQQMATTSYLELAIVGSGPAGLAASVTARQLGIKDLVIFEREDNPGGILKQCIHNGFGLEEFREELTGPEYAHRYIKMAEKEGIDIALNTTVLEIDKDKNLIAVSEAGGLRKYVCKSIILAMGCRERPRGAVGIPGTRPAGIFTAGHAQRLINIEGYMPGREIVVLGSGDIGLIMARRLLLEGAKVKAIAEILPYPSGLMRNVVQCLQDFDIPLLLSHTVTEIHGDRRVEGVTLARVDSEFNPIQGTEHFTTCDTLLLSVGLIPENELSRAAGIRMDPSTGGAYVNDFFETGIQGIFSCGNVLHVNDLADNVSSEGRIAAQAASYRIQGRMPSLAGLVAIVGNEKIGQVLPQALSREKDATLFIRVKRPMGRMKIRLAGILEKEYPYARPSEMIRLKVPKKLLLSAPQRIKTLMVECEES